MANLSHINGKAIAGISHWNGKAKASISMINGLDLTTPSTIVIDFEGNPTGTTAVRYDEIVISGMQSGDQIDISINIVANLFVTGFASVSVYYSRNSTSSWNLLQSWSSEGNYNVNDSVLNVSEGDTMRIRIACSAGGLDDFAGCTVTLTGGSFDSGSGTITASGTLTLTASAGIIPPP